VGELYRPAGRALDNPVVAAHGIQPGVPPVWAWESSDGGPGVAVLFWPGGRGDAAAGAGAELHQDDALTRPQTYTLHPRRLDVEIAGLPASFSPLLAATAPISTPTGARLATLWALLLDGRDDGIAGYDTVWVGLAGDGAAPPAALKPLAAGAWLVVALPGQPATGVALRLVGLGPDAATGSDAWQVTLYQSSLSRVAGSPESLVADLVGRLGPPVPAPDLAGLRAGTLALGDYASLAEQRAQWQMAAIAYVQERMAPRLTLATLDLISLLSWATFKAPAADIYDPPMRSAYREADQALGRLLAGLDLAQTTVFVGTPNGMAAAETALNLEALLDSLVPAPGRTVAAAYSSGGMAHIVLNLAGREPQGTLTREEFDRLVPDLARRLADFKLGERPAFGRVASGAGRRDLGLDHANSGDIVVEAAAGIYLVESDPTGAGRLSWAAPEVVAGYGSARPAMRGIFVLAGRRIANRGIVSPLELVDLAPTLAELVGLHVPAGVEGRVLREMLESEE